jgi:hypothetical protein
MHGWSGPLFTSFLLLPTLEGLACCLTWKPGMRVAVASTFPILWDQGYTLVLWRCLDEVSILCTGAFSLQTPLAPLLAIEGAPKTQYRHARRSRFHFSKSLGPGLHAGIVEMSGRGLNLVHWRFLTSSLLGLPGRLRESPGPQYDMYIVWLRTF